MAPYMLSEYNNDICLNLPLQSHGQLVRLKSTLNSNPINIRAFQQVTNPINNNSLHTTRTSLHNNTCKLLLPKRRLADNHRYNNNNNNNNNRYVQARAGLALPLVSSSNHWGTWSILVSIAAFGIWYMIRKSIQCIYRYEFMRQILLFQSSIVVLLIVASSTFANRNIVLWVREIL